MCDAPLLCIARVTTAFAQTEAAQAIAQLQQYREAGERQPALLAEIKRLEDALALLNLTHHQDVDNLHNMRNMCETKTAEAAHAMQQAAETALKLSTLKTALDHARAAFGDQIQALKTDVRNLRSATYDHRHLAQSGIANTRLAVLKLQDQHDAHIARLGDMHQSKIDEINSAHNLQLQHARETLESTQLALSAAQGRIQDLEARVGEHAQLSDMQDAEVAQLKQHVSHLTSKLSETESTMRQSQQECTEVLELCGIDFLSPLTSMHHSSRGHSRPCKTSWLRCKRLHQPETLSSTAPTRQSAP